jgi:tetratricopeptide (TPR) repeat protein
MSDGTVVGWRLVKLVGEYSSPLDRDGLATRLHQEWSPDCLALLLAEHEPRIVEAAARALGLVGDESNAAALADLLHHDDVDVISAAEEGLQYIAFRSAGELPQKVLMRLISSIKEEDSDSAITLLTELIRSHPTYAEAYHQRSHAYCMQSDYERALKDARRCVELSPYHFNALAIQGHCLAAMHRHGEALKVYRQVHQMHPTMTGIDECIDHARRHISWAGHAHVPA